MRERVERQKKTERSYQDRKTKRGRDSQIDRQTDRHSNTQKERERKGERKTGGANMTYGYLVAVKKKQYTEKLSAHN